MTNWSHLPYSVYGKKAVVFLLTCLFAASIFFRFYNLRFTTSFDFDQEMYSARPAKSILVDHDLVLLGARTGVGNLYVAPLYSYLAAFAYGLSRMDPATGAYLNAIFGTISLCLGYVLIKKIFTFRIAVISTFLIALSPLVFSFERLPANIILLPLANLLLTLGFLLQLKENSRRGWVAIGLGLFLGVNSHLSIVILLIGFVLCVLLTRRYPPHLGRLLILGFLLLAIAPILLFEYRYNFLLWGNLKIFLSSSAGITAFQIQKPVFILLETIGRVLIFKGDSLLQQTVGLCLFLSLLLGKGKFFRLIKPVFVSFFISYLLFTFYSGNTPDYYFMGIIPIAVLVFAVVIDQILTHHPQFLYFLFVGAFYLGYQSLIIATSIPLSSLGAKTNVIRDIARHANGRPISINYDTDQGHEFGFKYLFEYYGVNVQPDATQTYWISLPKSRFPTTPDYTSYDIALGYPDTTENIRKTKTVALPGSYKMRIPRDWSVLACPFVDFDKYILTSSIQASCSNEKTIQSGLVAAYIPDCNIWETPASMPVPLKHDLPLAVFPATAFIHSIGDDKHQVLTTAWERNRCLAIMDKENPQLLPLSSTTLQLIRSLSK